MRGCEYRLLACLLLACLLPVGAEKSAAFVVGRATRCAHLPLPLDSVGASVLGVFHLP